MKDTPTLVVVRGDNAKYSTPTKSGAVEISFLLDDRGSSSPPPSRRPHQSDVSPADQPDGVSKREESRTPPNENERAPHSNPSLHSSPTESPLGSASAGQVEDAATLSEANAASQNSRTPSNKRPLSTTSETGQPPTRKQTKWTLQEDELIIQLRGSGMKWENISKRFPGRSAIACRLHYQNFLERKPAWDEEKKNKLARLYERFKQQMWEPVAKELGMPWRAAEAMHWQLGSEGMASRAGTTPFSAASTRAGSGHPSIPEASTHAPDSYVHSPAPYAAPMHQLQPGPRGGVYHGNLYSTSPASSALRTGGQPTGPQYAPHQWQQPVSISTAPERPGIPIMGRSPTHSAPPHSAFHQPAMAPLPTAHTYPPSVPRPELDRGRMELPPPPPHYSGPFLQPPLGMGNYQSSDASPRLPPIRVLEEEDQRPRSGPDGRPST